MLPLCSHKMLCFKIFKKRLTHKFGCYHMLWTVFVKVKYTSSIIDIKKLFFILRCRVKNELYGYYIFALWWYVHNYMQYFWSKFSWFVPRNFVAIYFYLRISFKMQIICTFVDDFYSGLSINDVCFFLGFWKWPPHFSYKSRKFCINCL